MSRLCTRQNWGKLKCWEDMTVEERQETFGYKYTLAGDGAGR